MKKKILPFLIIFLGMCFVGYYLTLKRPNQTSQTPHVLPVIAITQIIEHPTLDAERTGIIEYLKANGFIDGVNIKIVYQNAQGNMATSTQIATQLISQKPSVLVAISTPSAQSAVTQCREHKIPMIFTAVTAPVEAKLRSLNQDNLVTGISDRLVTASQMKKISQLVPGVKKIGLIYSAGEANSMTAIVELRAYAEKHGLELIEAVANKTSDVAQSTQSLLGRVDMIYIPNDNTAVAAMKSIAKIAIEHKIIVITGDEGSVQMGALASIGYNRKILGEKAGRYVVAVLKGQNISDLPIDDQHTIEVLINRDTMEKINYQIPEDLKNDILLTGPKS